jgi:hypothetical protein
VVAATKTVPVVFSAVTDPVAAKLVPSWEPSKTNVTGVSDLLALDKQMELVKKVAPTPSASAWSTTPAKPTRWSWSRNCRSCCPSWA